MSSHHRSRRLALQGVCCLDAQGGRAMELVEQFIDDSDEPAAVLSEARRMLRGAFGDRASCDAILARHARHWDLARLAMVDRNILRLAVHELREGKTPFKVVITEALRLAREFSTAESSRFVNGVLDAVVREIQKNGGRDAGDARDKTMEQNSGRDAGDARDKTMEQNSGRDAGDAGDKTMEKNSGRDAGDAGDETIEKKPTGGVGNERGDRPT